jgi:KaiC/GvpD/RAD55 family RecA-like ATPase
MIDDSKIKELSEEVKNLLNLAKNNYETALKLQERLSALLAADSVPASHPQQEPRSPVPSPAPIPSVSSGENMDQRERKISMGNEKIDELLTGGVRVGSGIVLIGPPFSGKYILAWNFIAQSLKESVPVVIITTDRDINEIKYQVGKIYPAVDEAENDGLLKFVDIYSRSIQAQSPSKHATVIDSITNISSLLKNTDLIGTEIRKKYPYYRLLFTSLTSYATELDEKLLLKFVQQFSQKRKSENCVSIYLMEAAVFDKKLIEAVAYLVDGMIEFKNEASKSFLKVTGLGNVRSRDWIEIYTTDTSFDLGSFTLEKIR